MQSLRVLGIKIDQGNALFPLGQRHSHIDGKRRFANPALARNKSYHLHKMNLTCDAVAEGVNELDCRLVMVLEAMGLVRLQELFF